MGTERQFKREIGYPPGHLEDNSIHILLLSNHPRPGKQSVR